MLLLRQYNDDNNTAKWTSPWKLPGYIKASLEKQKRPNQTYKMAVTHHIMIHNWDNGYDKWYKTLMNKFSIILFSNPMQSLDVVMTTNTNGRI
jgi:hypothetical protein